MLIDSDSLKDIRVTDHSVIAKAKRDEGVLLKDELVVMVEGVGNFIDTVLREFPKPKHSGSSSRRSDGWDDFHTFSTWDECINTFKNNAKSLVKYEPTEVELNDPNEQGEDLEYDVTGDFIDMGRHMEGIPEVFGSLHNGNPRSRRVRIYIDNSNSASLDASKIAHRSERVIRLVDALEGANVRCELVSIETATSAHVECVVKRYDESLVLEDVAVATHPDFLRRLIFRIDEWSDTWFDGYGDTSWLRDRVSTMKSKLNDELTVFVHSNMEYAIDDSFSKLEAKLVEEMSEVVPAISLIEVSDRGVETVAL